MDLPTYTNIWRIEKRLYKLYDFRLPAPLPITWIAVFAGITVPYIFFLVVIGLPFNHSLVWLYVLPPGLLTWLTTRPVIESKRLPELVSSQVRYLSEPKTWCRMAPLAEKDDVYVTVRVWHRRPPGARPKKARKAAARGKSASRALETAAAAAAATRAAGPVMSPPPRSAYRSVPSRSSATAAPAPATATPAPAAPAPLPAAPARAVPLPVSQRAAARPGAKRVRAPRAWWPEAEPGQRPLAPINQRPSVPANERQADEQRGPAVFQRPSWAVPPAERRQDSRALEVSHDPEPDPRDLGQPGPASFSSPAWPQAGAGAFAQIPALPEVGPFPEVGAFPEVEPFPEDEPFPQAQVLPRPEPEPAPSRRRSRRPSPIRRRPRKPSSPPSQNQSQS